MTKLETLQLKLTATRVRMGVIEATHGAGCGHPGGSLSAAPPACMPRWRSAASSRSLTCPRCAIPTAICRATPT